MNSRTLARQPQTRYPHRVIVVVDDSTFGALGEAKDRLGWSTSQVVRAAIRAFANCGAQAFDTIGREGQV